MEHNMNNVPRCPLSAAALSALAQLSALGEDDRQAVLAMLGTVQARRPWAPRVPGELPTLTGLVPERDREAIYASAAWAAGYRRTTTIVAYVAQAQGLARLSAELDGTSVAKVGTSTPEALERRIRQLGTSGYGAWVRGSRRYEREPGFEVFLSAPRLQLARQHPASPLRLSGLGIEVDLPPDLSPAAFEATLNDALAPLRLQSLADLEAGRALCTRTGVDPLRLHRFYRIGATFKAATELTLIRPQADIGALARLCADIVIDAVLGLRRRRPVR